ncbi:MAG: ribosomal-processing cysteine protease Prp [Eubacteriales bacterium]
MINITIYINKSNNYVGFKAHGHAGMAESGQDIVCAAASVLMINTINAIDEFTEDAFSSLSDETDATIEFTMNGKPSRDTDLLLKTMVLGLRTIAQDYKKYINLKFEEV